MSSAFEDWTEEDVLRHNARIKAKVVKSTPKKEKSVTEQRRPKYGNQKIVFNGEKYDSKKEFNRARELQAQERLGIIHSLERQKKFVLQPSFKFMNKTIREISYIADFVYIENGNQVVEDVKSPITRKNPIYMLKKKMMMYVHGIEVKEV